MRVQSEPVSAFKTVNRSLQPNVDFAKLNFKTEGGANIHHANKKKIPLEPDVGKTSNQAVNLCLSLVKRYIF